MINGDYYYNGSIKKIVAVFGTIFNEISVASKGDNGDISQQRRVPIAYGPAQKFLAIAAKKSKEDGSARVAMQFPRMAFEYTSIDYDATRQKSRLNRYVVGDQDDGTRDTIYEATPYNIAFELSIIARRRDEILQIVEQILPYFAPEFTVSVKDLEVPGTSTDVPIILNSVNINDDWEGDAETGRQTIIYTMMFTVKTFISGPVKSGGNVIKNIDIGLDTGSGSPRYAINMSLNPPDANAGDNFDIITTYGFCE